MQKTERSFLITTLVLVWIGVIMVYSASAIYAFRWLGDSFYYLKREILYCLLGLLGMACWIKTDYRLLKNCSRILILVSFLLLLAVFLPRIGRTAGGARRWIEWGKFTFQPAEFVKLGLIIYLSDFLSRKQKVIKNFYRGFLPVLLITGATAGLILLQPDLGTAVLITLVAMIVFFAAGIKSKQILSIIALAMPVFYFLVFNVPYRLKRVLIYLNPWQDPKGAGWQIIQSYLALGSGGFWGIGLGQSRQKLFYLPQSYTDFILAIVGEELGFLGTASIIMLFILFIWQGMKIALKAKELFGALLSFGIVLMIGLQAIIHIAVVNGVIPTKGLPLPFISYGGSSLIFSLVGVGMVISVARYK
ncbi:MAG: putative lipid II flippase FtsW [Candidatus Omnitrophota bacterium]|nr:putative lipid II flippase FtsW [Candidatus Omnitrophota bacterium]